MEWVLHYRINVIGTDIKSRNDKFKTYIKPKNIEMTNAELIYLS